MKLESWSVTEDTTRIDLPFIGKTIKSAVHSADQHKGYILILFTDGSTLHVTECSDAGWLTVHALTKEDWED